MPNKLNIFEYFNELFHFMEYLLRVEFDKMQIPYGEDRNNSIYYSLFGDDWNLCFCALVSVGALFYFKNFYQGDKLMKKLLLTLFMGLMTIGATLGLIACGEGGSGENQKEHPHAYTMQEVAPTCTEKGYIKYSCECGYEYKIYSSEALGHSFTNYVSNNNATYDSDGTKTATCDRDNCNVTDTVIDSGTKLERSLAYSPIYDSEDNIIAYSVVGIEDVVSNEIVIPKFYKDLPVTSIGDDAFYDCDSLQSIEIPDSVESIGSSAFSYCTSLQRVDYLGTIDQWVEIDFENYASNPLRYAEHLYINDKEVTEVNITTATKINANAFDSCKSITKVTIGDSVESIGSSAFYECYKLVEVINKSSLTITKGGTDNGRIGYYALRVLTEEPTTSNFITEGDYTFYKYEDKYYLLSYNRSDTNLTLPNSVSGYNYEIYEYAFYKNTKITSVTIPNGVTSIGSYAFYNCTSIERVDYTGTIEQWVGIEFGYDSNPLNYAKYLYINDKEVTEVNITTATKINEYAFNGYKALTKVTIGDSVESIGDGAFSGCTSLESIEIPDSVESIGQYAFLYCTSLQSIIIPDSVQSIGSSAFSYCTSLQSVTIGDSVESIGGWAFNNCDSLQSVTIGDSVVSIGNYAFDGCYKLVEVINKSSYITVKKDDYYSNGRLGYYALRVLTEEPTTSYFITEGDYTFYNGEEGYYLISYNGSDTDLTLPDSVDGNNTYEIYEYAFYENNNIKSVTIPNGVTSIGDSAFSSCDSLQSITIGDSVESIGYEAFYNCYYLKELRYKGTEEEWNLVSKGSRWNSNVHYGFTIYFESEA